MDIKDKINSITTTYCYLNVLLDNKKTFLGGNELSYTSFEEYLEKMGKDVEKISKEKFPKLHDYFNQLKNEFDHQLSKLDASNFWEILPVILGIDSKLVLLNSSIEDIQLFDFSEEEVIQNIENDYQRINQEMCGYKLGIKPHDSLIFDIK